MFVCREREKGPSRKFSNSILAAFNFAALCSCKVRRGHNCNKCTVEFLTWTDEREGSNVANELLLSQTRDPGSGCDRARVTRHGSGQDFRQDDT